MECCASTVYALLSEPDLDLDDFRYGQLLVVATALAVGVIAQVIFVIFT